MDCYVQENGVVTLGSGRLRVKVELASMHVRSVKAGGRELMHYDGARLEWHAPLFKDPAPEWTYPRVGTDDITGELTVPVGTDSASGDVQVTNSIVVDDSSVEVTSTVELTGDTAVDAWPAPPFSFAWDACLRAKGSGDMHFIPPRGHTISPALSPSIHRRWRLWRNGHELGSSFDTRWEGLGDGARIVVTAPDHAVTMLLWGFPRARAVSWPDRSGIASPWDSTDRSYVRIKPAAELHRTPPGEKSLNPPTQRLVTKWKMSHCDL